MNLYRLNGLVLRIYVVCIGTYSATYIYTTHATKLINVHLIYDFGLQPPSRTLCTVRSITSDTTDSTSRRHGHLLYIGCVSKATHMYVLTVRMY